MDWYGVVVEFLTERLLKGLCTGLLIRLSSLPKQGVFGVLGKDPSQVRGEPFTPVKGDLNGRLILLLSVDLFSFPFGRGLSLALENTVCDICSRIFASVDGGHQPNGLPRFTITLFIMN